MCYECDYGFYDSYSDEPPTVSQMVEEFHLTYGCDIGADLGDRDLRRLRFDLIEEEVNELSEALGHPTLPWGAITGFAEPEPDLVKVADALGDIAYVVYGAALAFGINLDEVVREIHRSNMSKLGEDGKPIVREDGKILKGPNYSPPNLRPILGLPA